MTRQNFYFWVNHHLKVLAQLTLFQTVVLPFLHIAGLQLSVSHSRLKGLYTFNLHCAQKEPTHINCCFSPLIIRRSTRSTSSTAINKASAQRLANRRVLLLNKKNNGRDGKYDTGFYVDLDTAQSGEQLLSRVCSRSAQIIKKYHLMLLKSASKMEVHNMETLTEAILIFKFP